MEDKRTETKGEKWGRREKKVYFQVSLRDEGV